MARLDEKKNRIEMFWLWKEKGAKTCVLSNWLKYYKLLFIIEIWKYNIWILGFKYVKFVPKDNTPDLIWK